MFLSKNPNGRYYVYYSENGKRKSISTKQKTKAGAIKFLTDFRNNLEERRESGLRSIKFSKLIFEFLKYSESIHSYNHTLSLKSTFKGIIKYFGNINANEITKGKLLDFMQYRSRIVSPFAVIRDINSLSSLFNWAVDQKYIKDNLCRGIKRPRLPEKLPEYFTKYDFQKLISSTESEDLRDIFSFAVNTGLRQMELLKLTWNQIDLSRKLLSMDNRGYLTKTKKIRVLPLYQMALEILEKRMSKNDGCKSVFTYKGQLMSQQFISHKIKKIIKRSGVNPKLNFQSLRHTFASWLVQAGVPIYEVSKLMGHCNIQLTEIYAHLDPGNLRNAVEKLEI